MGYTLFDQSLAWQRYRAAVFHVRRNSRICDIGCGLEASFLRRTQGRVAWGVGLDYQLDPVRCHSLPVVLANIGNPLPLKSAQFDHVIMLAVLEHLPQPDAVLREIFRILAPGGSLIMTWPSAAVDPLLHVLHRIGIVSHEMESQDHQPRISVPDMQARLRQIGFAAFDYRTFQFGLNNLMVSHKLR